MDKFTQFYESPAATFTDFSDEAADFSRDTFAIPLPTGANEYYYIGLPKEFYYFYVELSVANTNAANLTLEYYHEDNAAWTELTFKDETQGFTRNGFIRFDKPEDTSNLNSLWGEVAVNSSTKFWIRISTDTSFSAGTVGQGIGLVFSDDNDLIEERGNIVSKHAPSNGSWINKHVAAKKEIIQRLRNKGNRKTTMDNKRFGDIDEFDLLEFEQVRAASKFLALSKIFCQELSDAEDDKWFQLGKKFEVSYEDAFNTFFLSLDLDDDGVLDSEEELSTTRIDLVIP